MYHWRSEVFFLAFLSSVSLASPFVFFRFSLLHMICAEQTTLTALSGLPMKRPPRKQSGCNRSWPCPKKALKAKWPSCKRRAKPRTGACLCPFLCCCLQNWTFCVQRCSGDSRQRSGVRDSVAVMLFFQSSSLLFSVYTAGRVCVCVYLMCVYVFMCGVLLCCCVWRLFDNASHFQGWTSGFPRVATKMWTVGGCT